MAWQAMAMSAGELTTPQKGAVWGVVLLGHWLVVWGLLSVKVPQMPSTPVAPIQVEWIELANLATATPNQAVSDKAMADLTDNAQAKSAQKSAQPPKPKPTPQAKSAPTLANQPIQKAEQLPKPKPEPKSEPKPKSKPKTNTPILTNTTPNAQSWAVEPQEAPQQSTISPPAKDNGKQGNDSTSKKADDNDKANNKANDGSEPKGDKQGNNKGEQQGKEQGNKGEKGDKDGKPSSQAPSNGNNSQNNAGTNHDNPNPAKSKALEQNWTAKVRAKIERSLNYPDEALSKKWSGTPTLKITIDKAGNVLSVSVVKSSGKAVLDDEAIATAQRASPLPVPPDEIMNGQASKSFRIPVRFDLKKHQ